MREYLALFLVALAVTYLAAVLAREVALWFGAIAAVRDRDVVPHGEQDRRLVRRDARGVDAQHVGQCAQTLVERGQLVLGHRGSVPVVDHDLGAGVAGLGQVGAEQVDAALGGGAGGVPVLLGGSADGGGARPSAAAGATACL